MKKQSKQYNKETGAGHAARAATTAKREEVEECRPLTVEEKREIMRAEAEASRLEIMRLRKGWEDHQKETKEFKKQSEQTK